MNSIPQFDDELLKVHLSMAAEALPGPDYYAVLGWIHQAIRPASYVEIGIRQGESLRIALPETKCIGIDPLPDLKKPLPPNTQIFEMTSDDFFASQSFSEILGEATFSLAFIDGLHLFEQALRDFINLERFATSRSIVMVHDPLPLDRITSARVRSTHFYSGDIWKLAMCLRNERSDLNIKTIRTAPTGLCLVSNFGLDFTLFQRNYDYYVKKYVDLTFDDYLSQIDRMPERVSNTREIVTSSISSSIETLNRKIR